MTAKEGKMCLCPEYRWLELRLPEDKQAKRETERKCPVQAYPVQI